MSKLKSIAILTSLISFCAHSGSLDVHGEIKVNGKTVIDAKGNYLGNLPSQVDRIDDLDSYLDPSFGIKKTLTQTQTNGNEIMSGTRIDDYTTENVISYTYKWPLQGSVYTSSEIYFSSGVWISSGVGCAYNPSSTDESSCEINWYDYQSHNKKKFYWQNDIQTGASFLESYQHTATSFYCDNNSENSYSSGPCDITDSEYLGDRHDQPITTNFNQVVMVLNKLSFENDTLSFNDCLAIQFNGNNEAPWTGIYCKNIGMVKAWNNQGYSVELMSVEGNITKSMHKDSLASLRARSPIQRN